MLRCVTLYHLLVDMGLDMFFSPMILRVETKLPDVVSG